MPAKNCAQYRAAGAAAGRGEEWGKEMTKKTPPAMRKRCAGGKSTKKSNTKVRAKPRRWGK